MAEMSDFELLRNELDRKMTAVTVENVKMSQAIGSYGERFNGIEARMDASDMRLEFLSQDMDRRFDSVDRQIAALATETDRRFNAVDRRMEKIEDKLDNRFGWQTFLMVLLGLLVLYGDSIRSLVGL